MSEAFNKHVRHMKAIGLPPMSREEWEASQVEQTAEAPEERAVRHKARLGDPDKGRERRPHRKPHGQEHAQAERGNDARRKAGRKRTQAEKGGMPGDEAATEQEHVVPDHADLDERNAERRGNTAWKFDKPHEGPPHSPQGEAKRNADVKRRLGGKR